MSTKVNSKSPTLRKTKYANFGSGKSSAPKAPYAGSNYGYGNNSGGLDYRDRNALINTAAAHPKESLGFDIGTLIGNYINRGQDKAQGAEENEIYNGILGQFSRPQMQQQQAVANTYGGQPDMRQAQQDYLNSTGLTEAQDSTYANAVEAENDAAATADQMVANGMPITAGAANVMGLSPKDQAQQAVVNGNLDKFNTYGANGSQAMRQEAKFNQMAEQAQNQDLSTVPYAQLEALVDQQLANSKMSYSRKQAMRQNILGRLSKQADTQANSQAMNMLIGSLNYDPNSKEYETYATQMLQRGKALADAGRTDAAALLIKPISARKQAQWDVANKLDYARRVGAINNDIKMDLLAREAEYKSANPSLFPTRVGRASSGDGTTTSKKGTKEKSTADIIAALDKENLAAIKRIEDALQKKQNDKKISPELEAQIEEDSQTIEANKDLKKRLLMGDEAYYKAREQDIFDGNLYNTINQTGEMG